MPSIDITTRRADSAVMVERNHSKSPEWRRQACRPDLPRQGCWPLAACKWLSGRGSGHCLASRIPALSPGGGHPLRPICLGADQAHAIAPPDHGGGDTGPLRRALAGGRAAVDAAPDDPTPSPARPGACRSGRSGCPGDRVFRTRACQAAARRCRQKPPVPPRCGAVPPPTRLRGAACPAARPDGPGCAPPAANHSP